MEQRRDSRFAADQTVAITLLGEPANTDQGAAREGTVKDVSGRGIGLLVDRPIAPGTPLKIDLDDAIVLGEVMYCRNLDNNNPERNPDKGYAVGVQLQEMLSGLRELGRMALEFAEQMQGEPVLQAGRSGTKHGARTR